MRTMLHVFLIQPPLFDNHIINGVYYFNIFVQIGVENMKLRYYILFIICAVLGSLLLLSEMENAKEISFSSTDITTAEDSSYFYTPGMLLCEGDYTITIDYFASADCRIDIYGDYNATYIDTLNSSTRQYTKQISLTDDSQGARIRFTLPADGTLEIYSIIVSSAHLIYTDAIYFTLLYLLMLFTIWFIVYKGLYKSWSRKDIFTYGSLLILILIASLPQLRTTLIDGTDLGGQLIRLEGVKDALLEHQFPVILYPRTANEYGEFGFMYPHLFLYPLAILRILNVSLTTVYSTACVCSNIICVFITFWAVKSITKSEYSALLTTIIFTFLPVRLATITHAGSVFGSGFSSMFLALLFAGIYMILFDDTKKWWYLTLGLTGIFQSHLVTAMIALLITVILFLCFIKKLLNRERFIALIKAAFVFIMINLWYLIPFVHYYATESLGYEALGSSFLAYDFPHILFTDANYCLSAILLISSIYYLIRYRKDNACYYPFILCLAIISLCLMLSITTIVPWDWFRGFAPIRFFTSTLQFASRLYIVTGLMCAILFSVLLNKQIVQLKMQQASIGIILIIMLLLNGESLLTYIFGDNVMLTQKIGYLQPYIQREYLPPDTENEFFSSNLCTLSDEENIHAENYSKHGSRLTFTYTTDLTDASVEVPLFYYNDYVACLEDGTQIILLDGTHHKLRIVLPQTNIPHTVTIFFEASPLYKVWVLVSVISAVVCIYLVKKKLF